MEELLVEITAKGEASKPESKQFCDLLLLLFKKAKSSKKLSRAFQKITDDLPYDGNDNFSEYVDNLYSMVINDIFLTNYSKKLESLYDDYDIFIFDEIDAQYFNLLVQKCKQLF